MAEARYLGLVRQDLLTRSRIEEEKIISRLVSGYRAGTLTTEKMFGGIGELSAMRHLVSTVSNEINQNKAKQQELLNGTQNEEDSGYQGRA